jgi:hypothetical protein
MTRSYVWHNHPDRPDESYCSQEKVWKPKSEFNWYDKQHGILQQICRDCEQQQRRASYANNKERAKVINRVSMLNTREESREFVYQYLCEYPCVDCGETNPLVLTFDHVRGIKKGNISDMVGRGRSIDAIKAEIAKCDVVCFNCHMKREHKRRR